MLVVFWLVNLYSLLVYIEHNGDESPKETNEIEAAFTWKVESSLQKKKKIISNIKN
jgi:hypothetical protein